jgi:homoserine O-succinyltransferase
LPIIAHNNLPAFARLRAAGFEIAPAAGPGAPANGRELRVGLLNLMCDAALEATERQFLRLLAARRPTARIHVTLFTLAAVPRGPAAREHIARHYVDVAQAKARGLDALIITGTNITTPDLTIQPFWAPLQDVMGWAWDEVPSTLLSCLATHAVLHERHGQPRARLAAKCWGVFPHVAAEPAHSLLAGLPATVDVPHSRWNEVFPAQFAAAGLRILLASEPAGVHLATSPDGLRQVYMQGHAEYDAISLLKEFKREALAWAAGREPEFPPYPENYLPAAAVAIVEAWRAGVANALAAGIPAPTFPEADLAPLVSDRWRLAAETVVGNWVAGLGGAPSAS